jgi:hypothetical protein
MSFLDTLDSLWTKFTTWLRGIGEDVMDFLEPIAQEIAKSGGIVLVQIAQEAVLAAEAAGGSGSDKFNAARKTVENGLKAQGIPIVINAINAAIEAAVAKMKAAQA